MGDQKAIRFSTWYKHESTPGVYSPESPDKGETLVSTQNESVQERLHHLESHHADRVMAFRQHLVQVGFDRVLILLLDIGKNVHWATALTAAGQELIQPFKLPTTRSGLDRFLALADPLIDSERFDLVLLGLSLIHISEPTRHTSQSRIPSSP